MVPYTGSERFVQSKFRNLMSKDVSPRRRWRNSFKDIATQVGEFKVTIAFKPGNVVAFVIGQHLLQKNYYGFFVGGLERNDFGRLQGVETS
ncbi:hypothetical protein TNCT_605891 [Trichonephila clavata]|uniref:Uncharacterized protein n=1 Tax=Trichonephila clavata TaxID=2740835 RepID=A0A8X6KCG9_TRICU|nr:hypothetical protein TNCT_605891 [Trichonephila clavata]